MPRRRVARAGASPAQAAARPNGMRLLGVDSYGTAWFHDGMDEVFQALANETRRQVVTLLREGGLPASEIAGHFDMTREGVSKHLQVLLRAGLVRVEPQGQQRIYTLEPA